MIATESRSRGAEILPSEAATRHPWRAEHEALRGAPLDGRTDGAQDLAGCCFHLTKQGALAYYSR